MAENTQLFPPSAGQNSVVPVGPDAKLEFAFDHGDALLSKDGQNLVFTFGDGGTLTLEGFYDNFGDGMQPPTLIVEGMELPGETFLAALNDPELMPATGPAASPPTGGGTYADADLAGVDGMDGLDKLDFDGWGGGTEPTRDYTGTGFVSDAGGLAGLLGDAQDDEEDDAQDDEEDDGGELPSGPAQYELLAFPNMTEEWTGNVYGDTFKYGDWIDATYKQVIDVPGHYEQIFVPGHYVTVVDVPGHWERVLSQEGWTEIVKFPIEATRDALKAGGNETYYSIMPNGALLKGDTAAPSHSILVEARDADGKVAKVNGNNNSMGVGGGGKIEVGGKLILTPKTSFDPDTGDPMSYSSQMLITLTANNGTLDGHATVVANAYALDGSGKNITIPATGFTEKGNVFLEAPEGYYIKDVVVTGVDGDTGVILFTTDMVYDTKYIDHLPEYVDLWVPPTYKQELVEAAYMGGDWIEATYKQVVDVQGHYQQVVDVPAHFTLSSTGNVIKAPQYLDDLNSPADHHTDPNHVLTESIVLFSFTINGKTYFVPAGGEVAAEPFTWQDDYEATFTMSYDGSYKFELKGALTSEDAMPPSISALNVGYTIRSYDAEDAGNGYEYASSILHIHAEVVGVKDGDVLFAAADPDVYATGGGNAGCAAFSGLVAMHLGDLLNDSHDTLDAILDKITITQEGDTASYEGTWGGSSFSLAFGDYGASLSVDHHASGNTAIVTLDLIDAATLQQKIAQIGLG